MDPKRFYKKNELAIKNSKLFKRRCELYRMKQITVIGSAQPIPPDVYRIAEELGNKIVTNIVMVGAFTSIFSILKPEAVKESVIDSVPKRFTELNIKAFERGLEAGKNALKEL